MSPNINFDKTAQTILNNNSFNVRLLVLGTDELYYTLTIGANNGIAPSNDIKEIVGIAKYNDASSESEINNYYVGGTIFTNVKVQDSQIINNNNFKVEVLYRSSTNESKTVTLEGNTNIPSDSIAGSKGYVKRLN